MSTTEPIASPVHQFLDLFAQQFADVKFADLDTRVLVDAAARVTAEADAVTRAEAALEAARATLLEGQEALYTKAQRALAYARIYAEDDADLSARLDAIALPRPLRRPPREAGEISVTNASESAPARRRRSPRDGAATLFQPPPSISSNGAANGAANGATHAAACETVAGDC